MSGSGSVPTEPSGSASARRGIFFGFGRKHSLASTCGLEARPIASASGRRRDRTVSGLVARVIPGRILRVGGVSSWLQFAHLLGCEGCLRILPRGFPGDLVVVEGPVSPLSSARLPWCEGDVEARSAYARWHPWSPCCSRRCGQCLDLCVQPRALEGPSQESVPRGGLDCPIWVQQVGRAYHTTPIRAATWH